MTTSTDTQTPATVPTRSGSPVDDLRTMLGAIELDVLTRYTLADAIREGSRATDQASGTWGDGYQACALSAGVLAARARGYVK